MSKTATDTVAPDHANPPWLSITAGAVLLFLCLPILIVVPMSFSSAQSLQFPPPSLSLRWYEAFFTTEVWQRAGVNSLILATLSSTIARTHCPSFWPKRRRRMSTACR